MGDKGSANQSGMMEAMASAQAAQEAYSLGEQQLQWTQQVWNKEQPLVDQATQAQIDLATQETQSLTQSQAESQQQWNQYLTTYAPLEAQFAAQAENWASPQAIAEARGQAMADVGEQGQAGLSAAAETLRSYGVNPGSGRYAGLYTGAQPMIGAAEAAAGTTAAQNLRMQQMGLESGAINTGRGLVNSVQGLTGVGTQAAGTAGGLASGAAGTSQSNLSTGSTAMTAPTAWFNAGANNMNSYVNAVNGYNQSQAEFAQAGASEMSGFGSAIGSIVGLGAMPGGFLRSDERDKTDIKREGTDHSGIPLYSFRYKEDPKSYPKVVGPMAQDIARIAPHRVGAIPGSPKGALAIQFDDGGVVDPGPTNVILPGGGHVVITPEMRGAPAGAPGPTVTYPGGQSQQLTMGPPSQYPPMTAAQRQANNMGPIYSRATGRAVFNDPRAAPAADPRTIPAWKQGYDDGGDVGPSDPQLTPTQGGGATGIPPSPIPPSQYPPGALPSDATPGGGVPAHASPSNGQATDDVPAMLTANEFVIPKDVATWKGHEFFAKQIDAARRGQQQFSQRGDVGGEPADVPPQQPAFISRPTHMGTTRGAIPGTPQRRTMPA
jgi:hypothetical protein